MRRRVQEKDLKSCRHTELKIIRKTSIIPINFDNGATTLKPKSVREAIIKYYNEYKVTTRNNEDYISIINSINRDDLVVYVTSLFDIRLDFIDSFKNVIVVLTKKDILPKSVKDYKLINYINERYRCLDVEVISSIKNYNLDILYNQNIVIMIFAARAITKKPIPRIFVSLTSLASIVRPLFLPKNVSAPPAIVPERL